MKTRKLREQITNYLLFLLITSFFYGIIGVILSINGEVFIYNRQRSEYIKISLQCILGISALFFPSALERKFKISLPNEMHILFVFFLFLAIILGEVRDYYHRFNYWDTVLHTLSGIMLSSYGFSIIDIINNSKRINLGLSNRFMALFSFSFAIMLDTLWEIIEFTMDLLMDLNMQTYISPNGSVLIGRAALFDTMKDLIVDVIGALIISIVGYVLLKRRKTAPFILDKTRRIKI
jgi:hypothetical protein